MRLREKSVRLRRGLIGKNIKIVLSKNRSLLGLEGRVVDETKCTLALMRRGSIKRLLKNAVTFEVAGSKPGIDGRSIIRRAEDR